MTAATEQALTRAKLVLATDELTDDEREHELARWWAHLDSLPEADDDAARHELLLFWQLLDGLMRSDGEP